MAFLSEGVKSPCPRGYLFLTWGLKNCKFLSEVGLQKKCPRGITFSEKCLRG